MTLKICTWLWGDKYSHDYVRKWKDGVRRHVSQPHEIVIFCPDPSTEYLTKIQGCFCRLKMFDRKWQRENGISLDDRLVCTDLDVVFTGPLDPLFERSEPFVILGGANAKNPCPFNGSIMMLRGGHNQEIWSSFSLEAARKAPYYEFPDDQGWLWHKLPNAATWQVGQTSGIYSFQKRGWPGDDNLPAGARMVVFPGWRDPSKFTRIDWVKEHWT